MSDDFFRVDKDGLAKILGRKDPEFIVYELVQNAWDEASNEVKVRLTGTAKPGLARLSVEDDSPDGFRDLADAYTLFADSYKKDDPTKRGRFNLGEKLVLALCEEATITSTTGTICLMPDGSRKELPAARPRGTEFDALIRLTKKQIERIERKVQLLLPPIPTWFNGERIEDQYRSREFVATLDTETANSEGVLTAKRRDADIRLVEPTEGDKAMLYEGGIPVMKVGGPWHVDVGQKVPLTLDRENVRPAFLRELRTRVLNAAHDLLTDEQAAAKWVTEAMDHDAVTDEALNAVLDKRFGKDRVMTDPSDPEANKLAASKGMTVVAPRSLPRGVLRRLKDIGAILPAGQVTPSPKVEAAGAATTAEVERTDAMNAWAKWIEKNSPAAIEGRLTEVRFVSSPEGYRATWANESPTFGTLTFNVRALGKGFFEGPHSLVISLVIHEWAHAYSGDHLSESYHDALSDIGARIAVEAGASEGVVGMTAISA